MTRPAGRTEGVGREGFGFGDVEYGADAAAHQLGQLRVLGFTGIEDGPG
ncbi:hypothetical protein HEP87_49065 [Streptomyces sp. S1D4-11]|nr:hypothetical protein [Streptomyces sp. S1D4-11]QIZ00321.1 hypothetical protein HEP87_49065 [Streptomyces sp. S1D4-11]